jgi:hypothetical protein
MNTRLLPHTLSFLMIGLVSLTLCSAPVETENMAESAASPDSVWSFDQQPVPFEFHHSVDTRFVMTVRKSVLQNATRLNEVLPDMQDELHEVQGVEIALIDRTGLRIVSAMGSGPVLNAEQIKLLRGLGYADHLMIRIERPKSYNGHVYNDFLTPHLSIVPEQQARYTEGDEALVAYLREASAELTAGLAESQLQSGKIEFTIDAEGRLTAPVLHYTSGYEHLDAHLLKVIAALPGTWQPARDAQGQPVAQTLVYSFGLVGC